MVVPKFPVTDGVKIVELLKLVVGVHATEVAAGLQVALMTAFCLHNKFMLDPALTLAGSKVILALAGVPTQEPVVPVAVYTALAVGETTILELVAPVLQE